MPALTVHLPAKGKILVSVGQKISPGDILAQGEDIKRTKLNLATLLKVKPSKLPKLMVKKIGEEVGVGEVIAQKTSLFSKARLKSPVDGVLENLDEESGTLTIKEKGDEFVLKSEVSGKVAKIEDEEKVVIEIAGVEIEAAQGAGPKREGKIAILKGEHVRLFDLTSDLAGKIVVGKVWDSVSISKAQALGVAAGLAQEIGEGEIKGDFTFLVLSSHDFEKVLKYEDCPAVVWGDEKQIIINK